MKKITAALLLVLLVFSLLSLGSCSSKNENVLRVGMECNYAPFNWTQSESNSRTAKITSGGYADGYDVQMAKIIADKLGKKLEIVKTEWNGLTLAVQSGDIDLIIAGMSPTAERKVTIDFSDPYYESDLVIVVQKDGKYANAKTLDDFKDAKITAQLNTFHYTVIDQLTGVDKQTAMEDFPAMIVALQSGKIDGYISELPGAKSAVTANPDLTYVQFTDGEGFEASPEDIAVAVGLNKGSDLTAKINEILAQISKEDRQKMMEEAIANQPLNEG